MTLDDLLRKGRVFLLLGLVALVLTSCSGPLVRTALTATVTEKLTITLTVEPPVYMSPTPDFTATPTPYPTIDASVLPPVLQDFLSRYNTFEEMNAGMWNDYHWMNNEVFGLPEGSYNASPMVALEQRTGSCSEISMISALFAEKLGYKPYLLLLASSTRTHSINVFQDPETELWGYNDNFWDYQQPTYKSISELAVEYIYKTIVGDSHYDAWYLMDLGKAQAEGINWRTEEDSISFYGRYNIDSGEYSP